MKFPSKVLISGVTYTVSLDKTRGDGECDLSSKHITIGIVCPSEAREIFFHEVFEATLHERGHRYMRYEQGNDGLRFVMDHHDFENVCKDLIVALKDFPR